MQHPNPGPLAQPRLRPNRAPSSPALGGAGGRRTPAAAPGDTIVRIRLPATSDGPLGRIARRQLENHVARIIAILDSWDGDEPDSDGAEDDVLDGTLNGAGRWDHEGRGIGSEEDAEDDGNDEPHLGWTPQGDFGCGTANDDCEHDTADSEPNDAHDFCGDRLIIVSGGVPL